MSEESHERLLADLDARVCSEESKVWIFQANPRRYDLLGALMAEDIGNTDVWMVTRYRNDIRSKHIGILWLSGAEAGIYAIVDIISNPKYLVDSDASTRYWKLDEDKRQKRLRVRIKYRLKLLHDKAVRKEELKSIPDLKNLSILRYQRGTNFPASKEEWLIISDFIRKKLKQKQ